MTKPMTDEMFAAIQQRAERQSNADVAALIAEVKWLRFDREQIDTERAAAVDAYNELARMLNDESALAEQLRDLRVAAAQQGYDTETDRLASGDDC